MELDSCEGTTSYPDLGLPGVTLDVARHLCLAHHLQCHHHLLLLREHLEGEEQWATGHDDCLQVGVEVNAAEA